MRGFHTHFDYIGKMETLDKDLKNIGEQMGISLPALKKTNISKPSLAESSGELQLGREDQLLLEDIFADDFNNFGYQKLSTAYWLANLCNRQLPNMFFADIIPAFSNRVFPALSSAG